MVWPTWAVLKFSIHWGLKSQESFQNEDGSGEFESLKLFPMYFSIHLPHRNRIFDLFEFWYLYFLVSHFVPGRRWRLFQLSLLSVTFKNADFLDLKSSQPPPAIPSPCSSYLPFLTSLHTLLFQIPHKCSAFEPTNLERMMSWLWRKQTWWWWLNKAVMVRRGVHKQ